LEINHARLSPVLVTTVEVPVPGRMNVCDDLCPKWCEKVAGTTDNFTHCHYVCGNVCSGNVRTL